MIRLFAVLSIISVSACAGSNPSQTPNVSFSPSPAPVARLNLTETPTIESASSFTSSPIYNYSGSSAFAPFDNIDQNEAQYTAASNSR